MTPRTRIVCLNLADAVEVNWRKIVASGHSSFLAYEGNRDNVAGIVSVKALWANLALAERPNSGTGDRPRQRHIQKRDDGSWLVDGLVDIDELKKQLSIRRLPGEEKDEFQTLAGFILSQLGHIPAEGERFECEGLRFEVIDMDKHRIDKVLITPLRPSPA